MTPLNFGSLLLALASLLYLISFVRLSKPVAGRADGSERAARSSGVPALVLGAWLVHLGGLATLLLSESPARFGFAQALCATLWVSFAILLYEARSLDMRSLMRVLMPVAAVVCILALVFPGQVLPASASRPEFLAHLMLGTAAYGVLLIGALHALLMVSVQKTLQSGGEEGRMPVGPFRLIGELPPLMTLERMLFGVIGVGFVLLSLTLLLGTIYSDEVFGRAFRLDHKTVFTFLAWAVFAVLLVGRKLRGWRGRTALRFTLFGFALMLLGYVGSRFVMEVMLGR